MVENQDEFKRGQASGKRDARLDAHDEQFDRIDSALLTLIEQGTNVNTHLNELTLRMQELALNAKASADTALVLAEGVEKERSNAASALLKEKDRAADTIRQEKQETERIAALSAKLWTPFTRFIAALASGVSIMGLIIQYNK